MSFNYPKKRSLFIAMFSLCCLSPMSHAGDFTGFSAGALINASSYSLGVDDRVLHEKYDLKKTNPKLGLFVRYGVPLSPESVLSFSASLDLGSSPLGTHRYTNWPDGKLDGTINTHAAVFVEPGMRLSPDDLIYGKLGLHQITGSVNYSEPGYKSSTTSNFSGISFGGGYRHNFDKSTYAQAEIYSVSFSEKLFLTGGNFQAKPSLLQASVGIGKSF